MMRRVLIYAAIYGGIGALVGVCMAIYTADVAPPKSIILRNGSAAKGSTPSTPSVVPEVAEPSPFPQEAS